MRRNTCPVCLWDALGHALMHSAPWSILVSWYVSSSQAITIQCGDFRLSQLFLVLSLLGSKMRFYSQPLGLAWLRWQHDVFRHTHWPQCSFSSGTGLAHRCRFLLWKLSFCVAALGAQLVCKMFFHCYLCSVSSCRPVVNQETLIKRSWVLPRSWDRRDSWLNLYQFSRQI